MTRRIALAVLALALAASAQTLQKRSAPAPQTARQALIELLTAKTDAAFERHLPEALLTRVKAMETPPQKGAKPKSSGGPLATATDVHFFDTGSMFATYAPPKGGDRVEFIVDRDEATPQGEELEFSIRGFSNGAEVNSALLPRFMVHMKQEEGTWRVAQIGFSASVQLDDGPKLDALMQSVMKASQTIQQQQQPKAPRRND
jgi:hypothetical protein